MAFVGHDGETVSVSFHILIFESSGKTEVRGYSKGYSFRMIGVAWFKDQESAGKDSVRRCPNLR